MGCYGVLKIDTHIPSLKCRVCYINGVLWGLYVDTDVPSRNLQCISAGGTLSPPALGCASYLYFNSQQTHDGLHHRRYKKYVLQCVAVCCSVLQCVAVCCNVLRCVAVS